MSIGVVVQSVKALEEIDQTGLEKLQDKLLRVVGKDL
jgi:hypothetical protein